MSIKQIITGLTLSLLLSSGAVVAADYADGVAAYESEDFNTALTELMPLAKQGDAMAQIYIGVMYEHGEGVPENDTEAVKWYEKAADQGDVDAQRKLSLMYKNRAAPQGYLHLDMSTWLPF